MAEGKCAHERLAELYEKLDQFFASVAAKAPAPDGICCRPSCADCCRAFSITEVEADFIATALARLPATAQLELATAAAQAAALEPARAELPARSAVRPGPPASPSQERRCPALGTDDRCLVYPWRPAICRTHGLALRLAKEPASEAARPVPPTLVCCPLNFQGRDLSRLAPALVLDQQTLSTMLAAIDALYARERGHAWQAARVAIGSVLPGSALG